jgi:hypothetical protein
VEDGRRPSRLRAEDGSAVLPYVAAVTFTLLFFVLLAQFVVWQYGKGVVRDALDEGARAGAPATAGPAECEARAKDVLNDLLGGRMGRNVSVHCEQTPTEVVARATVTFSAWIDPTPDWSFRVAAGAAKEQLP